LRLARGFAENGQFDARNLSNATHGIAKLHEAGQLDATQVDDTLAALEAAAVRVAPDMKPQDRANTAWFYATLGRMPGEETWAALEAAARRVAPGMDLQALANTAWSFVTLGRMPMEETWGALDAAAGRVAPDMKPQELANTAWAYTALSTSSTTR
jgi:hypothetical protein